MSDYILHNGVLSREDALSHHGVKGMKWGVRREEKRNAKLDKRIAKRENLKQLNSDMNAARNRNLDIDYGDKPKKAKKLAYRKAYNNAELKGTDIVNNWEIARSKAKKDKTYKNGNEYQQAKTQYGKWRTQTILHGNHGATRIEALKETGYSSKAATGKVIAENALATITGAAIFAGATIATLAAITE